MQASLTRTLLYAPCQYSKTIPGVVVSTRPCRTIQDHVVRNQTSVPGPVVRYQDMSAKTLQHNTIDTEHQYQTL
eukprot:2775452-Rhodomonas_salina.2